MLKKAPAVKFLALVFLGYYFIGLLVYYNTYSNFVQNRRSGIPFELMSIFSFDQARAWEISYFFAHGQELKEIWIYGAQGLHNLRDFQGAGLPLSMHAIWGDTVEDKMNILERYTYGTYPDYLPNIQWDNNKPSTGHETLTHIATRAEVISPLSFGLIWTDEAGEQRYTSPNEIIFTTNIYSIQNIWLLFHTIEPREENPQLRNFLNTEKQTLLRQAKDIRPGNVNRSVLFYGLNKVHDILMARQRDAISALPIYLLVLFPTLPVKWLLFAPMFYVPYEYIDKAAGTYFYFLVVLGVAAFLLFIRVAVRNAMNEA